MKRALLTAFLTTTLVTSASFAEVRLVDKTPTISVTGQCLQSVNPDKGRVVANAIFVHPSDAKESSTRAIQAYEKALARVKKLDLKDAEYQTVNYNLSEKREYINKQHVFKGYQASIGLSVTTSDTKRLGEVIATLTEEDFKSIHGLSHFISQQKLAAVESECYVEAVKDAEQKAERMAKTLNVGLGRPLLIQTGGSYRPAPQNFAKVRSSMDMAVAESIPAPTIESQAQDVNLNVNVTFALD